MYKMTEPINNAPYVFMQMQLLDRFMMEQNIKKAHNRSTKKCCEEDGIRNKEQEVRKQNKESFHNLLLLCNLFYFYLFKVENKIQK